MNPFFGLGQAVHNVLENLANIPTDERLSQDFDALFKEAWVQVSGKKGGFTTEKQEEEFKARGKAMVERVKEHPGPIARKAIKIKQDLPHYWLSEEDNLILCGKLDWIEYLEETDGVHILDFKTGRTKESGNSLQLPIYLLLAQNIQGRLVQKMSYWYLNMEDEPEKVAIPDEKQAYEKIMDVGKRMKLARQLKLFNCPEGTTCKHCSPYEAIIKGKGEFVGIGEYNKEVYIMTDEAKSL